MQFRTQIPISKSGHVIGYDSEVVSLGSCFAVNMAAKFDYFQFRHIVNPFGILFHPVAIEKLVTAAESKKSYTDADVFFHNERWHCFDAHSDLSGPDKNELLQKLNLAAEWTNKQIRQTTHIIITYGTAWVYHDKSSAQIVANCHKMPQSHFTKSLLSMEALAQSVKNTIDAVVRLNPQIRIIFTVSPVRHIKDGFVENQRSKSHLIAALHKSMDDFSENAAYFPAYEIMMDELRDYRFYAEDMIHPNQIAIDYIWERFSQTHISEAAFAVMEQVSGIRKKLAHRPFNPDSESHKLFLSKLDASIVALTGQFPHMHF